MATYRQHISNIRGANKLLSSELLISDRLIASELRIAANMIVQQSINKRQYLNSPNLFTPILCLKMEETPLASCCEYVGEKTIAKSTKQLPQIGEGIWGLSIQRVTGLDSSRDLKESTPGRYSNLLKLKLTTKDVYYWIQDGYLFVSNPLTEMVNLFAYFTEDVPNDLLFPGKDCKCVDKPDINDLCTNPLDKPFKIPGGKLLEIERLVSDKLLSTFTNLREDKTSDNNDDSGRK